MLFSGSMAGSRARGLYEDEQQLLARALPSYELIGVMGRGGFAVVYAARHRRLEREVAIKRLSPDLLLDGDARDRFAAEARLLASLDHPHIVRIYDYVESEQVCVLVMERLHGGTLADRMRLARLPPATSVAIALAALQGLEHAHQHGVLHRDVKPENLLFGSGDLVKVADFGIAKVIGAHGARLTVTAGALGTPAYMAPEQIRRTAGTLSPATDVWSLSAVLYELLAGEPPFPRDPTSDLADAILARVSETARPLDMVVADVPPRLAGVVMRALEPDPNRRFGSAAEFAAELERAGEADLGAGSIAATGVPIHPTPAPSAGVPYPTERVAPEPGPSAQKPRFPDRRRAAIIGGLIAAVATAVALAVGLTAGGGFSSSLAGLPAAPAGWPTKLALGTSDPVSKSAGVAALVGRSGIVEGNYGIGDAAAGRDWSHDRVDPSPYQFALDAQRHGLLPVLAYFELPQLGQGDNYATSRQLFRTLVNRRLMGIYWRNVRAFFKQLGRTGRPAAVDVELSVWSGIEQQLVFSQGQPSDVVAIVGSSGLPELRGLPDNIEGYGQAFKVLRDRYAPKVLIGAPMDFYGTNDDLRRVVPSAATIRSLATEQGQFFANLSSVGESWDYADFNINGTEQGENPNASQNYASEAKKQAVLAWIRQFEHVTRVPIVLLDVPQGNTVMKTIDNRPYHWSDSWVQWLMGDSHFTHLRQLRDAGVIGVEFGVAAGRDETCFCDAAHDGITNGGRTGIVSHSPDDDGGYFRMRVTALRSAGGLPLALRR